MKKTYSNGVIEEYAQAYITLHFINHFGIGSTTSRTKKVKVSFEKSFLFLLLLLAQQTRIINTLLGNDSMLGMEGIFMSLKVSKRSVEGILEKYHL